MIILKKKIKKDIMEEKNEDSDYEYEEEDVDIIKNYNSKILGEKIILKFNICGKVINIEIGMDNNFIDAAIKFGTKFGISTSEIINNCKFFINSNRPYDIESRQTLKEIGIRNCSKIEVIYCPEVIAV